jgi:two-component system, NarL family, sensor histidine kinase DesK
VRRIGRWDIPGGRSVASPSSMRALAAIVWLAFIVFPVADAFANGGAALPHWLAIAGAAIFTAIYVWLVIDWTELPESRRAYVLTATLLGIAIALTVAVTTKWGFLFSYVAACAGLIVPAELGFVAVVVVSAAGVGSTLGGGGDGGSAIGYGVSALGVGLLLTLMRDLRMRNRELDEARAELASTAVAAERERFARDLHDLLGHSLSVIAIKAELAGRLLPGAPDRAAAEVADLESVARTALGEVRQAVSGYRQPTLDGELEGARIALTAAGIIAEFERSPSALAPEVEAVLAWAVREGATNVIRHSGARHCEVRIRAVDGQAAVEVLDDGAGCASSAVAPAGNGLAGLRERTAALRGRLEAGAATEGGFRLAVSVPATVGEATV